MNERQLRWLEEAEETASPVVEAEQYVPLSVEAQAELERIERESWEDFWSFWRALRAETERVEAEG